MSLKSPSLKRSNSGWKTVNSTDSEYSTPIGPEKKNAYRCAVCWSVFFVLIGLVFFICILIRPTDQGENYNEYFRTLNKQLKIHGTGSSAVVLDLDTLDHNIEVLKQKIVGSSTSKSLRVVTKSVPSMDLIEYITSKVGTNKLMVFHPAMTIELCSRFNSTMEYLQGFPITISAVKNLLQTLLPSCVNNMQWLVDSKHLLEEYLEVARIQNIQFRISIEIDVGLHRGGIGGTDELVEMLQIIEANPTHFQFAGFMGYDGHIAHSPWVIFGEKQEMKRALGSSLDTYKHFKNSLKDNFPDLYSKNLTFNGAGSLTVTMYEDKNEINDLSVGSAFLKPKGFDIWTLDECKPAIYLAGPIIKKLNDSSRIVPFLNSGWNIILSWDPNLQNAYYVQGSGLSAVTESPKGTKKNFFFDEPPTSLMSTQTLLHTSSSVNLEVGDYFWFRPIEGDVMLMFEDLMLLRNQTVVGKWKTYRGGL